MMERKLCVCLFMLYILGSCGGNVLPPDPMKRIKEDLKDKYAYTILLDDMNLKGRQYYHKYKYFYFDSTKKISVVDGTWTKVSDDFFEQHYGNLGMEIYNKLPDGNINHLASPPGFSMIIGDTNYGAWTNGPVNEYGDSLVYWKFTPKYQFLERELGLRPGIVKKEHYDSFMESGFLIKPYYGEHWHPDSTQYGSRGIHAYGIRPWFFMRMDRTRGFRKNDPTSSGGSGGFRGGGGFGK